MNIEDLVEVQMGINERVQYRTDLQQYQVADFWEIAKQVGDCEDFALRKLRELLDRGWDVEKLRLAFCWVDKVAPGNGHCVLIAELDRDLYILDNRLPGVYAVLDITEYVWHSCQEVGGSTKWVPCQEVFSKFYP